MISRFIRGIFPRALVALAAAAASLGCSSRGSSDSPEAGAELPDDSQLVGLTDLNPDPRIVEVSLEARTGIARIDGIHDTPVWTYEGTVPGPIIDAHVGDEVIVHFHNALPEPTTIHWHGVRVPAAMDGTTAMQAPIPPGGTFDYSFTVKDAGLFWFHPHIRSDVQVHRGLYGVIRVRGDQEPVVDREKVLVLDDLELTEDGSISEVLDHESSMMGRGGNLLLVNGKVNASLRFRPGELVRLRVVNAANGRFFNLRLDGHSLRVIGTDGGRFAQSFDADRVLVSPGERYDLLVTASGAEGTEVTLWNDPYDRGHGAGSEPSAPLARVRFEGAAVRDTPQFPTDPPPVERLPDGPVDLPVVLDEDVDAEGNMTFTINGATHPDVPPFEVPNASIQVFGVRNDSEMDHPFHLHGFYFQVLSRNGVAEPAAALVNKDTIVVEKGSELELVSRMDEPGRWMYHCHTLEHAEGGMMGEVTVK